MRLCKDCRKAWISRTQDGKSAKAEQRAVRMSGGEIQKLKTLYPDWVYHAGSGRFCDKHAAQRSAGNAKRRAAELNATPVWADSKAIRAVYAKARILQRKTGVKHHVDHIIPLRGRNVSGLHVETNLQAIPATVNIRKSNKFKCEA